MIQSFHQLTLSCDHKDCLAQQMPLAKFIGEDRDDARKQANIAGWILVGYFCYCCKHNDESR